MRRFGVPRRGESALAVGGTVIFALWLAWRFGPGFAAGLDARGSAGTEYTYRNSRLVGQVAEYAISMVFCLSMALLFALGSRALRGHPRIQRAFTISVAILPLLLPLMVSGETFLLALFLSLGVAALVFPHIAGGTPPLRPVSSSFDARFVLLCEALTLGYGAYLVLSLVNGTLFAGLFLLVGAYFAGRLDNRYSPLFAVGCSPFLALPLLGMVRNPGFLHLGAFALAALVGTVVLFWRTRGAFAVPTWLTAYFAPTAVAMIPLVPLGLRELNLNHGDHEAFHFAWLSSVFHGKLLLADAGLVHGPLRDYVIALFLLVTRVDYAHVRVSFVLVNVIGIGLTLPVVWYAARRHLGIQLMGTYLLLMQTPARTILWYKHTISLGWADVTRTALPSLALYLVLRSASSEKDPKAAVRLRRVGGILLGASLLYSQEFGLCALLALVGYALLEPIAKRTKPLSSEAKLAFANHARVLAWAAVPVFLLVVAYAVRGKAGLLARSAYESIAFPGSGKWGALPFPLDATTIVNPRALLHELWTPGQSADPLVIFLLPPMIYIMAGAASTWALVRGRWTERDSFRAVFLGFGLLCYRVSVGTPEIWHLLSATTPAIVLLVSLVADTARASYVAPRIRARKVSGGVFVALAIAALSVLFGEQSTGVFRRLGEVSAGLEVVSKGPPNITVARAGDTYVHPGTRELLEVIAHESNRGEPIFVCIDIFGGAELYFLSDRRNPTRFDTMSEVITTGRQREVLGSLKADPPKFVIGSNAIGFLGAEVAAYLDENYGPYVTIGGYPVRRRK